MSALDKAVERLKIAEAEHLDAAKALRDVIDESVKEGRSTNVMQWEPEVIERRVMLIIGVVANFFRVSVGDILGRSRTLDYVEPRQQAMVISRQLVRMPYVYIGKIFKRDHGTIIHAEASVAEHCLVEPEYKKRHEALMTLCEIEIRRSK